MKRDYLGKSNRKEMGPKKKKGGEYSEPASSSTASSSSSNIRFRMIVHNNISQMYRVSKQRQKEDGNHYREHYLTNLLSAIMVVVENNNFVQGNIGNRRRGSSIDNNMEGFLQNALPLLSREICAEAA